MNQFTNVFPFESMAPHMGVGGFSNSVMLRYGAEIGHMEKTMKHLAAAQFSGASRAAVVQFSDFIAHYDELEKMYLRSELGMSREKRRAHARDSSKRKERAIVFAREFQQVIQRAESHFHEHQNEFELDYWLDYFLRTFASYEIPSEMRDELLQVLRKDFHIMRDAWGFFSRPE